MSNLIPQGTETFRNGEPAFVYNECYSCFEDQGNGLLFRLVNAQKKRWAFYNDTTDIIIRVKASFGAGSEIKALQRTELAELDGSGSSKYAFQATLEIEPGYTELFIEGSVNGFTIDFTTESAPAKNAKFENGGPSCEYDKVYKCFKNQGNGLLFRLVNEKENYWAFYNDTNEYTMKVVVEFDNTDEVTPLGDTQEKAKSGELAAEGAVVPVTYILYVQPCKTAMFVRGKPSVYKLSFAAEPLKPASPRGDGDVAYKNGKPDPEIIPHVDHAFKCFKEHDNGLLFRCVDDTNKIWAFYNDTTEYVMNVNVRFPPKKGGEDFAFAPNVQVLEDSEVPGGYIAATQVEPLQTAPFLVGPLGDIPYELAFSAQQADANRAVARPAYANGAPDLSKLQAERIDEVYKCFKDHGNGLLFRCVTYDKMEDKSQGSWAFYNDTTDIVAKVTVSFDDKAKVRALGQTKIDTDDEMGVVYRLEVRPGCTEPFVEGQIAPFTTKFTAAKTTAATPAAAPPAE